MTRWANWRIVNLVGVPRVDRSVHVGAGIHHVEKTLDQVTDKAEGPDPGAIAVPDQPATRASGPLRLAI